MYIGIVLSLDFDFQFLLSLRMKPFPLGFQYFIFWPYWKIQASSLLTVFSSESQIVSTVL